MKTDDLVTIILEAQKKSFSETDLKDVIGAHERAMHQYATEKPYSALATGDFKEYVRDQKMFAAAKARAYVASRIDEWQANKE